MLRIVCNRAISALAILGLSAIAAADQTYTIHRTLNSGEKWSFEDRAMMKLSGQVSANGQPVKQIDDDTTQVRKGTLVVMSVANNQPAQAQITFDQESSNAGHSNGQDLQPFSLAGRSVTLTRGADGSITHDLAQQPDEQTLTQLKNMMELDTSMYPQTPVAVGQEWDADPAKASKQFQLGPQDTANLKCKLLAVKEVEGRQVADISLVGRIVKHDQGFLETNVTLGGVARVDLVTGETLNADVLGNIATRGNTTVNGQNGQPVQISAQADGKLEMHQIVRPLAGVGGGAAAMAPNSPQPSNPLDAAAAESFAGSFKGTELTLHLTGMPQSYKGTLVKGDKQFPVLATSNGNTLSGTFKADNSNFQFTATLNQGQMTLSSGGSNYQLAKQGHSGGNQAPRNPLGQ